MHTLANKHNTAIKKIINKYGLAPEATQTTEKGEKTIKLMNYYACKNFSETLKRKRLISSNEPNDKDFLRVKINWRTTFKMNSYCIVCGSEEDIEMQHIRHVRKVGLKQEGFSNVVSQLNRKQLCLCKVCHRRVHNGLYDGLGLDDLYDRQIATF